MLSIDRSTLDGLGFDFEDALQQFTQAKQQHTFTVNVPSPTAHPLVEAAFAAGGFQVIEPPPVVEAPPPPADPFKSAALERLKKLQGKTVGTQLDEIRSLLTGMFENMPG